MVDLVAEVRHTSCSDDRDKIYALLGHATDTGTEPIIADYTKDIQTVYGDLVRHEVTNGTSLGLEILEHVNTPAPEASTKSLREALDHAWPSWIPDWRQQVCLVPFYPTEDDQPPLTDPCFASLVEVEFSEKIMSVMGFTLSEIPIANLTSICENDRDVIGLTKGWHAEMTVLEPLSPTAEYILSLGDDNLFYYNPEYLLSSLDRSVRRSLVADASGVKIDSEGVKCRYRDHMVDWDTIRPDDDTAGRIANVCGGRRMGKTTNGFIGIFPAAAQRGDIVAVFHGGHLLYLLRPVPDIVDHFRFVGACYLNGLMDGEAGQRGSEPRMLHLI